MSFNDLNMFFMELHEDPVSRGWDLLDYALFTKYMLKYGQLTVPEVGHPGLIDYCFEVVHGDSGE